MSDPMVSVVVPVYNGAAYLTECLDSVLGQSYDAWSCTIVDNASTDATPEIASVYAARDPRIVHSRFDAHVEATENHNRAFAAVAPEAEFCKVLQADDWLYPDCLRRMVEAAQASPEIGVVSAYQLWGAQVHLGGLPYTDEVVPGRTVLRETLLGHYNVTGGPTANMLRARFVREREPFYQEGFRHDDSEAMLWMHTRSDLAFVHQVLTFARRQEISRMTLSRRLRSQKPEEIVFLLRYGRLVLAEDEFRRALRSRLQNYVRWHVLQVARVSRLRDPQFFEFHSAKLEQFRAEGGGDRDVAAAVAAVRALLLRGAPARRLRAWN